MMCKYITKYAEISQQNFDFDTYTPLCIALKAVFSLWRQELDLHWNGISSTAPGKIL